MEKVLVLVEGQTEETFLRDALTPYLSRKGIYLVATLAKTKREKAGPDFKGGIVSYRKVRNDILKLLGDTSATLVTTMIDFYGLPTDFPGHKNLPSGSCYKRVAHLEDAFQKDINDPKFLPYFAVHEFEAMLFVAPEYIARLFPGLLLENELLEIKASFNSPEEIDEGPNTAPSKRLLSLVPEYRKPLHGPLATLEIGIDRIRIECRHFNSWITKLESLSQKNT
jgi:hypothetical protein